MSSLYDQIVGTENLYLAYRKARRGKRRRDDVAQFALRLEQELPRLAHDLKSDQWRPGGYRVFTVYERKPREISVAPFRDRIVHHALMNVIEPQFDRLMIDDSYACRRGKGVHRAVDRYQELARRFAYVLKLDVRKYFASVDHAILKSQLQPLVRDSRVFELLELIIDSSCSDTFAPDWFSGDDLLTPVLRKRGLPIGNLTSQIFANLYLNETDHQLTNDQRVGGYIRYVDDLTLFGDNKQEMWNVREELAARMAGSLRLRLHERKLQLSPTRCKVDFLGYQVSRTRRWLRNANGYRARRRLRKLSEQYALSRVNMREVKASVCSWAGHAVHAESASLRQSILDDIVFSRARA